MYKLTCDQLILGQHPMIDVIWFMNDLDNYNPAACLLGALARMRSHYSATCVNIVVKEPPPGDVPDFVRLLSATLHHGNETCLAGLAAVIPVWRGKLLLHHNQVTYTVFSGVDTCFMMYSYPLSN